MIKIDKNIPTPEHPWASGKGNTTHHNRKYPFDEMEIGDSFLCLAR